MIRAVALLKCPADGSCFLMSSIPICRERVTGVELRRETAVCQFGNQTKLFLSRFLGSRVAVGDEIAFAVATGNAVGHRNLDYQQCRFRPEPLSLPRAHRIRQPAQTGQTKSALCFGQG